MGLSERLAAYAVRVAHVLVVEVPGCWELRARTEQEVRRRGWRPASSPADADVLVVCGSPGPELRSVVDRLWDQLPGPRARVVLGEDGDPAPALDGAAEELRDLTRQRADARARQLTPEGGDQEADHGDMDHGDMGMAPAGIPLAGGGEDRDGLEMDLLHLRLGPVLPHWPGGLVIAVTLQGDVVVEADARLVDEVTPAATAPPPGREAARRCDAALSLLSLAGERRAADSAREARDLLMAGAGADDVVPVLTALERRVARSRLLRWSLRGLGRLPVDEVVAAGLPAHLAGDAYDRLLAMVSGIRTGSETGAAAAPVGGGPVLALLPAAVTGLDLSAVRLVVAGLDPGQAVVGEGAGRG